MQGAKHAGVTPGDRLRTVGGAVSPRSGPRVVYLCGVAAFVGSWLAPATANRMTDAEGTHVAEWVHPIHTQFTIALEPAVRLADTLAAEPEPDVRGDGFEARQAWVRKRALM